MAGPFSSGSILWFSDISRSRRATFPGSWGAFSSSPVSAVRSTAASHGVFLGRQLGVSNVTSPGDAPTSRSGWAPSPHRARICASDTAPPATASVAAPVAHPRAGWVAAGGVSRRPATAPQPASRPSTRPAGSGRCTRPRWSACAPSSQGPQPSEVALQGDGEPAPQLGGVPLPHHVRDVVITVHAQRGPEALVALMVPLGTPQRAAVGTDWLVAAGPARSLVANTVHRAEGGAVKVANVHG